MNASSEGRPSPDRSGNRSAEVKRLLRGLEERPSNAERQFNTLAMLITDASLDADDAALAQAHTGLQWLYRDHGRSAGDMPGGQDEFYGRLHGLMDVTQWALRRLPARLQLALAPSSHAARFLAVVVRRPGLSNQEIAACLGTDETEVSRVGRRLLAAGVVMRRKEWRRNVWDATPRGRQYAESSGLLTSPASGMPAIVARHGVGVAVLPRRLVGVLADRRARISAVLERRLPPSATPVTTAEEVARLVKDLMSDAGNADAAATVVGVQVGGHVLPASGEVVFAPNYEPDVLLTGASLGEMVEKATGLPTVLENDANALAHYERLFGDGREADCFATVIVGQGIGCGLITHGRLTRGMRSAAGELGHVVVEQDGPGCGCGNAGCLESVASVPAIVDLVRRTSGLPVADLSAVLTLANEGNKDANDAIQRAGDALGRALSILLNVTSPEKIILYGPPELVEEPGSPVAGRFLDAVRTSQVRYTFPTVGRNCQLLPKPLTDEIQARAAATVALAQHQ